MDNEVIMKVMNFINPFTPLATVIVLSFTLWWIWRYARDTKKIAEAGAEELTERKRPSISFSLEVAGKNAIDVEGNTIASYLWIRNFSSRPACYWVNLKFLVNGEEYNNWHESEGFYAGNEMQFSQPYSHLGGPVIFPKEEENVCNEIQIGNLMGKIRSGKDPLYAALKVHISGQEVFNKNQEGVIEYPDLYWHFRNNKWIPMSKLPEGWSVLFASES